MEKVQLHIGFIRKWSFGWPNRGSEILSVFYKNILGYGHFTNLRYGFTFNDKDRGGGPKCLYRTACRSQKYEKVRNIIEN